MEMKGEWCELPLVLEIKGERIATTAHFWLSGSDLKKYRQIRGRQWLREHIEYVRSHGVADYMMGSRYAD